MFLLQNGSASTSVPPATAPTVAPTNDSPSECDTPSAAGSNTSESRSSPTSTEPATSAITATKNAEDTMVKGTGEETSVSPGPIISLSETSNFPGNSAPSLEFLANVATSLQSMEKDFSIAQLEQKLAVVTAAISTGNEDEKISTESNQFDSAAAAAAAAAASGNLSAEEAESLEKLFEVVTVCKTTGESLPASNVSPQVSTGVDLPTLEPTGTSEGPIEGERDGALSPAYSDISDANEDESAPFLEKQTQGDKLLNNSAAAILLTTPAQVDAVPTESFAGMFLSPTSCPTTISSGTSQTDQITTALLVKSPAPANGDVINSAELTSSDIIAAKELDSGRKHPQDQLQLNHKSHKRLKESHSSGHKESEKTTGTTGAEKKVSGEMPTERPKSMTPGIKTPHNNNLASKENLQTHHSSRPKSSALTTTITTTANSSSSPAVVKTECRSPCATPLAGDQCRAGGNGMMRGFSPCPPLPYHPNMPFSGFSGMPSFGLPGGLPFDPSHPMFQAAFNPAMVGFGGPPGFVGNPMMFGPHGALPHDLRPPAKALDMLQRQASQYYGGQNSTAASLVSAAHKIHELAEHAKTTGTENTSGDPTSGKLQSSNGAESAPLPKDRVKGALLSNSDKQVGAEGTKSPPVQRHLHTHHHTHTVLGAQLDPYAGRFAQLKI